MENKYLQNAGKIFFMAVAVLMYYFLNETIQLGVFITYRHAFALALFALAFFAFLLKPNIARAAASLKSTFVYCTPAIVTFAMSLFIWFMTKADVDIIFRGLSGAFIYTNMFSFTFAAVAFLYVFGEKGIWYNLVAILTSNILMIFTIMLQYGIGAFLSEFVTLVVTFAAQTGDIIVRAEVHELAFCLGAYLIYMLLKPRKNVVFLIFLIRSCFCFLAAFKRIGIIAIVVALFFGWLLKFVAKFKKDTAMRIIVILTILLAIVLVGYVGIIKLDVFSLLEEAGINTSGRVKIYNAVDKFYEFDPAFLGNGIGFLSYQLSTNMDVGVSAVHNDFLQYFIDLGFFGYIFWLMTMTVVRVCYFGAGGKIENAIITFSLTLYFVIVSSTDNTVNYPLLTTVLAVIMIGNGFTDRVQKTEKKMFGIVSDANKETEGDFLL